VLDTVTGERLLRRAVETAADGTVVQVAATAPPGQDAVDVAGRWLHVAGLIGDGFLVEIEAQAVVLA
jgi:hypothetical protein